MNVKIEESWKKQLQDEFEKEYFIKLVEAVKSAYTSKKVYPPASKIFNAFELCPFEKVKVIIIGQDPYHGYGQAQGFCFSVPDNISPPPSLQNIIKELKEDLGKTNIKNDLSSWARQGVFLLNSILTVEESKPGSHQSFGWEIFTDSVIKKLSDKKENLVFILWGSFAQKKAELIDSNKHFIIKSPHPSPLSAHRGFFGSKPFSKANEFLKEKGLEAIEW